MRGPGRNLDRDGAQCRANQNGHDHILVQGHGDVYEERPIIKIANTFALTGMARY